MILTAYLIVYEGIGCGDGGGGKGYSLHSSGFYPSLLFFAIYLYLPSDFHFPFALLAHPQQIHVALTLPIFPHNNSLLLARLVHSAADNGKVSLADLLFNRIQVLNLKL